VTLPDQQQTSTDDTSPERHAHRLRCRPGLFLFALVKFNVGGLPDDAAPPAPCTTCAAPMMTAAASSRPAPRAAPMMPPPCTTCTTCTRSPRQQTAPPAPHLPRRIQQQTAPPAACALHRLRRPDDDHDGQQISPAAALQWPAAGGVRFST
jgi:hypothetical protein